MRTWAKLTAWTLIAGAVYWLLDSAYAYYLYVEHRYATNLHEGVTFLDTLFLDVPAYSIVNRITFVLLFAVGCVVAHRFFSDGKRREQALRENQHRLVLAMEGTGLGLWDWDLVNRRLVTDQRWAEMLGYTKEEFDANPGLLASIVHPDEWRAAQEEILAHLTGRTRYYESEYRVRSKSGEWVWVRDRGRVVQRDGSGMPMRLAGTHLDVTDHKKAELAMRQSEQRFRMLFENCPISIWESDWSAAKTVVDELRNLGIDRIKEHLLANSTDCERLLAGLSTTMANHVSMQLFGADSEEELLGYSTMRRLIGERDVEPFLDAVLGLIGGAREFHTEIALSSLDGREMQFTGVAVVYPGSEQTLQRVLVTLVDVTAEREAQQRQREMATRVQQAEKIRSLGVMARGIAHDFNNLATAIMGNVALAKAEAVGKPELQEKLSDIEAAASNAAELCRHMMAYSGEQVFHLVPSDTNAILSDVVRALEVTVSQRGSVVCRFAQNLPPVGMDSPQIRQVFINLITNARDALPQSGGTISVRTALRHCTSAQLQETFLHDELQEGDYVQIDVIDTGCGMDKETQARIFDPFFSTKTTGRGLGLASVVGIIRGHKGAIQIQSVVGTGTTMSVFLPVLPVAPGHRSAESSADLAALKGRYAGTVLLADDQSEVRRTIQRMLSVLGFEVLAAADGAEAVALFRRHAASLTYVLLDFSMPKLNGVQAYLAMKDIRADIPVIIASGYDEQVALEELRGDLPAEIVQKPLSFDKVQILASRFGKLS